MCWAIARRCLKQPRYPLSHFQWAIPSRPSNLPSSWEILEMRGKRIHSRVPNLLYISSSRILLLSVTATGHINPCPHRPPLQRIQSQWRIFATPLPKCIVWSWKYPPKYSPVPRLYPTEFVQIQRKMHRCPPLLQNTNRNEWKLAKRHI